MGRRCGVRDKGVDAAREQDVSSDLPDATNDDIETWAFLLEGLADCVLWDNDYESQQNLDLPPDKSSFMRNTFGVADDYYTAIAPDPPDNQVNLYLDAIKGLTAPGR